MHDPVDDPSHQPAETVHQPVGRRAVLGELGLVADQEHPHQRQHQHHRHEGDADREPARHAERADQRRLREQQGAERQQRRGVRQHARRPDHAHGEPHRLALGVALAQADADGRDHLHAVGEAHHHHERRHDVEEQVELDPEPAQQAQRPQHRQHRRQRRQQHQRHALEEDDGDDGAEQQAETVVDDLVALHRVADLELHHRRAGQMRPQPGAGQLLAQGVVDAGDDLLGALLLHRGPVEGQHGQRQLAVVGQELARNDLIALERGDHGIVGRPVGQLVGNDRRRIARGVRLAARRQHRHDAVHAVGQLQVDDGAAEGFELLLLQEILALDHHQHVVFAGRKAAVDLLVAAEFLRVGAEQLGERIVDLEAREAPRRRGSIRG